jgi:hypothetical protein
VVNRVTTKGSIFINRKTRGSSDLAPFFERAIKILTPNVRCLSHYQIIRVDGVKWQGHPQQWTGTRISGRRKQVVIGLDGKYQAWNELILRRIIRYGR